MSGNLTFKMRLKHLFTNLCSLFMRIVINCHLM
jgi:hypothetical protein